MKKKIDLTVFVGITLFLFGLFSALYGIITVIIKFYQKDRKINQKFVK